MATVDRSANGAGLRHVHYNLVDGVAHIIIDRPPVNALNAVMRGELSAVFARAEKDVYARAVILRANGGAFCAGTDISEKEEPAGFPTLNELCTQIDSLSKPVIAAIHGAVAEAGLALVLCADMRIGSRNARFESPDASIGLVPGGGTTQRLTRLIGPRAALDMMLTSDYVYAYQAREMNLLDGITGGAAVPLATRAARDILDGNITMRKARDDQRHLEDADHFNSVIADAKISAEESNIAAEKAVIACVESALIMPFDMAIGREEIARHDLRNSEQHRTLSHSYFARRRLTRPRGLAPDEKTPLRKVGIIGGTEKALQMSIASAKAGLDTVVVNRERGQRSERRDTVRVLDILIEAKQITPRDKRRIWSHLSYPRSFEDLAECEIVVAMPENGVVQTKEERAAHLAELEASLAPDCLLIADANEGFGILGSLLDRPKNFLAFNLLSDRAVDPVIELVRLGGTTSQALARSFSMFWRLGYAPVMVEARDQLVALTLRTAGRRAIDTLLLLGAKPSQVDNALIEGGFSVPPCYHMDVEGLDNQSGLAAAYLRSKGRHGHAAGGGFYDYEDGNLVSDATCTEFLNEFRAAQKLEARKFTDQEIYEHVMLAQANCGAKLMQEGAIGRPIDIDVLMMGIGSYSKLIGGPMNAADVMTPLQVQKKLAQLEALDPSLWRAAEIWTQLVKNGDNFETLNQA